MSYVFSNLRVLMAEKRFNIQDIKDQTSLSRTTISNLVNNNVRGIQFDTVVELCELLECDISDLFTLINFHVYLIPTKKPYDIHEETNSNGIKEIRYKCDWNLHLFYHETKRDLEVVANVEMRIKTGLVFDFRATLINEEEDDIYHLIRDEYYVTISEFEKNVLYTLKEHAYESFEEQINGDASTMGIMLNYKDE